MVGAGRLGFGVIVVLMGRDLSISSKLLDLSFDREMRLLIALLEADMVTEVTEELKKELVVLRMSILARQSSLYSARKDYKLRSEL